MKIQTFITAILLMTCFFSCKKMGSTNIKTSSALTVTYSVTWSAPLLQNTSNEITYVNSTGNAEMDYNISGTSWTKTVTINNAGNVPIISAVATLVLQQAGTAYLKIYINGVLKAESNGTAINTGSSYSLAIQTHWSNQ